MLKATGSQTIINPAVKVKRRKHFLAAAAACNSILQTVKLRPPLPPGPIPLLSARWSTELRPTAQTHYLSGRLMPLEATLLLWGDHRISSLDFCLQPLQPPSASAPISMAGCDWFPKEGKFQVRDFRLPEGKTEGRIRCSPSIGSPGQD